MHLNKKQWRYLVVGAVILSLFLALRLPGLDQPYHQDEYKWPMLVNPQLNAPGAIPHPPLSEFLYREAGFIVGYDNFRVVPLFFSVLTLLMVFVVVRRRVGVRAAFLAISILCVSFYNILASLMVDTDGQVLPLCMLLVVYAYDRLLAASRGRAQFLWGGALLAVAAVGLLIKLSFIIAVVAIACDFCWRFGLKDMFKQHWIKLIGGVVMLVGGVVGLVLVSALLVPSFNLERSLTYWLHFINFTDRNYLQIFVQCAKAAFYVSPLLVAPLFLLRRQQLPAVAVFIWYSIVGLGFYLVPFDFSVGALDRYFQFLIVPLGIIAGMVIDDLCRQLGTSSRKQLLLAFAIAAGVALALIAIQFFPHAVPPQHPKAAWLNMFTSLRWNFVFPFSGGSGPLPFYVSFLFIAVSWIAAAILCILYRLSALKKYTYFILLPLLAIAIAYNGVFIEEYHLGKINGSAKSLVQELTTIIAQDDDIKMVTVYNDNGGYEVMQLNKYRKRLYVDPQFDIKEKVATLVQYKEHYLVINIPRLDPTSAYAAYFASCEVAYERTSKKIVGNIYDCRRSDFTRDSYR